MSSDMMEKMCSDLVRSYENEKFANFIQDFNKKKLDDAIRALTYDDVPYPDFKNNEKLRNFAGSLWDMAFAMGKMWGVADALDKNLTPSYKLELVEYYLYTREEYISIQKLMSDDQKFNVELK